MRRVKSSSRRFRQLGVRLESLEIRQLFSTLQVGPTMQYHTIQSAVNAAHPGDQIQVAPGTYTEQVTIPANLTNLTIQAQQQYNENNQPAQDAAQLSAKNLSIIQAPSTMTGAIVSDLANGFQIKGFVIEGPATSPGDSVQQGILITGATNVQIMQNAVVNIQEEAANSSDPTGTGIRVNGGGSAQINNNYVASYQKSGIVINASTAQLNNDVVVGQGPISTIAQNGVEFDSGAQGNIQNCVVTGNIFSPQTIEDAGILLNNSGQVNAQNNQVYNNDGDIILSGPDRNLAAGEDPTVPNLKEGSTVNNNQTSGATFDGISLIDGVNSATVNNNQSQNNGGGSGIFLYNGSFGNVITGNKCTNNAEGMLVWTNCTGNQFNNNQCNNNVEGIFLLTGCSGNQLTNNQCNNNSDNGIVLESGCNGNTLSNNNQCNNNATDGLLLLSNCTGNTLGNVQCQNNGNNGIELNSGCSGNTLTNDQCQNNAADGILSSGSSGNAFTNVNCQNNAGNGIEFAAGSTGNQLTNDQFNNNGNDGILFSSDSTGNTISKTQGNNNHKFDLEDDTTGGGTDGTANTYTSDDQFHTSNVPALAHH